jgi:8-oxo-dGTP pyrophosphatase MutT (NUDIX family)
MKNLSVIKFYFGLVFVLLICKWFGLVYGSNENKFRQTESTDFVHELEVVVKPLDCFEYAESVTGFSAEILRGIAATESDFRTWAIGDEGASFGMFQLHSTWHSSRVEKWGKYDPVDPFESAVIAGWIMRENLDAFGGDLRLAIAAYKQGVTGVRNNGPIQWYVDSVLNWRNDSEKVLSFFSFAELQSQRSQKMGMRIQEHKIHINLTIPLPYKYRGGGVAVFRKNAGKTEVLLGLRLNNPGKGKWSFPGGGAESKEKLLTAGIREFREEVGVQIYGRYITRIGVYKIQNPFFDWETQIIETTQDINLKGIGAWWKTGEQAKTYAGEFSVLEWIALEDLDKLRLHRWVMEAVKVYQSDKMQPYTPTTPGKTVLKKPVKSSPAYKVLQDEFDFLDGLDTFPKPRKKQSGADMLFDVAEMVLTKTDPDGTRYFMPRYAPAVTGKRVSKERALAWK